LTAVGSWVLWHIGQLNTVCCGFQLKLFRDSDIIGSNMCLL